MPVVNPDALPNYRAISDDALATMIARMEKAPAWQDEALDWYASLRSPHLPIDIFNLVLNSLKTELENRRCVTDGYLYVPKFVGFYWAKWRIADDGTKEGDELTPSNTWEVVQLINGGSIDKPHFYVSVPGVEKIQSVENFVWGKMVIM